MRDAVQTAKCRQIVDRGVVDEAAILGAHEHVMRQINIGAGAVNEARAGLGAGAREIAGVKDQSAHASQREWRDLSKRHTEDVRTGDFVSIGVHAEGAGSVVLGIEGIAVVGLDAMMSAEKESIGAQDAPRFAEASREFDLHRIGIVVYKELTSVHNHFTAIRPRGPYRTEQR